MKIKHIYSVILLISLLVSCGEDFLERAPGDLIDEKEVFSNLDNAEAFLNNAYREVPQLVYRNDVAGSAYFNLGSGTDEAAFMWGQINTTTSFNRGDLNPIQFPLNWTWFAYYNSIRQVNIFIKNFDLIPAEVNGQNFGDKRRRMYGEAHGLRAYYYLLLYSMWGEVPFLDKAMLPGGKENIYLPRTSLNDLIEKIDKDLGVAIEYLPSKQTSAEFGRITSVAAKAIRARMHLYYASPLSNPDEDLTRWQKAADTAKDAITFAEGNGYALSLSSIGSKQAYERIFMEMTNTEVIWSSHGPYQGDGRYWNSWAGALVDYGSGGESPLQELVDDYEMINGEIPVLGYDADGNQIINPKSQYNSQDPYINRDKRFYQTILYHGSRWKGRIIDLSYPNGSYYDKNFSRTNYYWRKYMQENYNMGTGSGFSPRRFIVFRLSELYLNYAEALNEVLASPNDEVYNSINVIRRRAGLPDLPAELSKEEMRERIHHERRIELVMENHRFFDVRRWKIAEHVDNKLVHKVHIENGKFTYPVWGERIFDKNKHYLFPIPQSEIDKNRDNMTQNQGWK